MSAVLGDRSDIKSPARTNPVSLRPSSRNRNSILAIRRFYGLRIYLSTLGDARLCVRNAEQIKHPIQIIQGVVTDFKFSAVVAAGENSNLGAELAADFGFKSH